MKKLSNLNGDFEYELLDENQQVADLREKLVVLYSSPFADILWWELYDPSLTNNGYHKLFYYEQNELKHIILFNYSAKAQKKIFVVNEKIKISIDSIENICYILFYEFAIIEQIIFEKVFESDQKQSPKMIFDKTSNDVIIPNLPNNMDAYMKSLGSSTRKKINLMTNRIAKDFPDFKVYFYEKSDILYEQIEKVVLLNRNRMKTKGEISLLNDTECKIRYQYASTSGFGFLCACEIDGKIIGGTINSVIREHAYMHIIAHDNSYNKYSVGQIALIHATKYLIEEKNIKYYHLLGGTLEYKFRHGGINHELYTIRVFRNNDIFYFFRKIMSVIRTKSKNNKTIICIYTKLRKIKIFYILNYRR